MVDMHRIYTLGYLGRTPAALLAEVSRLGALLVDARFMPRSRSPVWSKTRLAQLVGPDNYIHLKALGNANYKSRGSPVILHDPEGAVPVIAATLRRRPVILLCACRDPAQCHRVQAAAFLAQRLDVEVVHL